MTSPKKFKAQKLAGKIMATTFWRDLTLDRMTVDQNDT